jgi:outer membrane protein
MAMTTSRPASLPPRAARFLAPLVILLAALPKPLSALEASDPFDTRAITPPRPALDLSAAEKAYLPCQALPNDTPYGVLEVVDLALCKNPTTREIWAIARLQAAEVGVAQAQFLPALDGQLAANRLHGNSRSATARNASLTLSWLLVDFGARSANLEVARQLLSAASATLDATVQSVFLSALQSYFNTQAARAAVTAALESEKASRESLTAAEVRYRVGSGTPADRLQAQTAWSQATLNRIRSEGVLRNALGRLAKVMGLDANHPLRLDDIPTTLPDSGFDRDVAALISEARRRRPEMQAAAAELKAAEAGIDYARAAGRPTISLSGGPQWEHLDGLSGQGNSIGLSVQLPIFSGFNTTYQIRAAEARSEASGRAPRKHSPAGGAGGLAKLSEPEHRHPDRPQQRRPAEQCRAVRTRCPRALQSRRRQYPRRPQRAERTRRGAPAAHPGDARLAGLARRTGQIDRRPRQQPAALGQRRTKCP